LANISVVFRRKYANSIAAIVLHSNPFHATPLFSKSSAAYCADLHVHTLASDGAWSAAEVVTAASQRGVNLLAITDHDSIDANDEAKHVAARLGVRFVSGLEISAQWHGVSVHVVGLNVDAAHSTLVQTLASVRTMRESRGRIIGRALELIGIENAYEGSLKLASAPDRISRTHFARYLVAKGHCASMGDVFSRYMKPGKPAYVPTEWMSIETAVKTIHEAGGDAVLAHPARYDLQWHGGAMALLRAFKEAGGDALEVLCASHTPADWSIYAAHCRSFGFKASLGSDFHSPKESRVAIGDLPRLPGGLTPVWSNWDQQRYA
jgi:3',5'-nucleoside bisphosphate phosphatase